MRDQMSSAYFYISDAVLPKVGRGCVQYGVSFFILNSCSIGSDYEDIFLFWLIVCVSSF